VRRSPRRRRRWLLVIGIAVLLLAGTVFGYVRVKLEGPDLADKIASVLNKRMRGRIEIGAVEWPTGALKTVVSGGWVPVIVRDVKVWDDCVLSAEVAAGDPDQLRVGNPTDDCTPDDRPDPDPTSKRKPRKLLLKAPLLTAEIDIHALMFGRHDFVFRNLWVHGGEVLLEQTREPYPLHAYDRTIVSIVTAFYPRMKAGFRAGIYADAPAPIFDLRDIHVEHLNMTVHMGPYTLDKGGVGFRMTARLEDVNADSASTGLAGMDVALENIRRGADPASAMVTAFHGHNDNYLHMDATDPLVAKFYVRLALHSGKGRVRIFDEGPRASFHIPTEGGVGGVGAGWYGGRNAWYDIELSDVVLNRLAQMPTEWARKDYVANTLELDLTAHTMPCKTETGGEPQQKDGADLHFSGELSNYWDRPYDGSWNLALDIKNLGPTLHTCIKQKMGGDNLGGRITLTGPFIALPKVTLDLHGLDYNLSLSKQAEPLQLTLAEVHGEIDLVNDQGSIEKTKALIRGGKEPGEVMVSSTFGLKPYNATASIDIVKPIDVGRFLPGRIATSVGRFLGGKLTAVGDVDKGFALEDFDLTLGPTPTDKLVQVNKGRIFTENAFDTVGIQKVNVRAGSSRAVFDGYVDTIKQSLNIRIDGNFPDLDAWLMRFGLPQFAKSAGGGQIVITGPLKSPTVAVRINLGGVPCMDNLALDAEVKDQIATITHVGSTGLGGQIDGKGVVSLAGGGKVIEKFHLEGRKLDASRLCGLLGIVKGTLDIVDVDVKRTAIVPNRPPLDWLASISAFVKADHLSLLNDPISKVSLCINHPDDKQCASTVRLGPDDARQCADAKARGGACIVANAERDRGGQFASMIIDVPALRSGRMTTPRHLGGTIDIDNIPLTVLDQFVGKDVLGGLFSTTLHLQGSGNAPQADGTLWLIRSWVKGAFVGDSQLQVAPIMVGKMPSLFIRGSMLAGQLGISATVGTAAPYPVELSVTGRRVEIDQFLDLAKKLGLGEPVQAWASGTVTVHTELAPLSGKPAEPEAWVEVTELEGILNHRSRDGRLTPLRFGVRSKADQYAMSLHVTPQTIELACRDVTAQGGKRPCSAALDTPAGVVTIEGGATQSRMNLHAKGSLMLARLAPFVENQIEDINGSLELDATVAGTFAQPTYEAGLTVGEQINVRPAGVDTTLQVLPGGQIKISDGTVGINQLTITVKDEHATERGDLHVKGVIGLGPGFIPTAWGVLLDGKIGGKMLLAIAPNAVAQAGGLARIDGALTLFGHGSLPQVTGTITFDPEPDEKHPAAFTFSPRGARKEIALLGGSIDISTTVAGEHRTYQLGIDDNPLTASIDGEGKVENIRGDVVLRDGKPQSARVFLDAENIPFRIPGTLDLIVSAKDISLELPGENTAWIARGNVSIVSGNYERNFELTEVIRPEPAAVTPARPLWDEYPSIGNADLGLTLDVRKFAVKNNIAEIDLEGPRILIKGSPRDLRMSGSIRVQRGEFKIPGTRAKFTRTIGSIDFAENEKAANPKLDVQSDADYLDLSGQLHIITLNITGTLEQPQWDLKTSTGYNKSQTLALLFLGRNPEQLRRTLGDQSPGANPTQIETTTNPSQGFADQIVKDLAGQWVSDILGDKLTKFTALDVLRFEVGFGSVGVHAEKKAFENIKFIGEGEQTIRGYTVTVTGELKTPWRVGADDRLMVQGVILDKNFSDPAEQDILDVQGKLVYRLFIP
jgi:hypothetical protein